MCDKSSCTRVANPDTRRVCADDTNKQFSQLSLYLDSRDLRENSENKQNI